eukprot:11082747-Alexandrium_andersonii.AAC.1
MCIRDRTSNPQSANPQSAQSLAIGAREASLSLVVKRALSCNSINEPINPESERQSFRKSS